MSIPDDPNTPDPTSGDPASGPGEGGSSQGAPEGTDTGSSAELDPTATMVFPRPSLAKPEGEGTDELPIAVEVIGGPMDGLAERHTGESLSIGRTQENDLSLPHDPSVSSGHARIVREGRTFFLEDLGSRNGTIIGDQPIEGRVPLGAGASFVVGRTRIELLAR